MSFVMMASLLNRRMVVFSCRTVRCIQLLSLNCSRRGWCSSNKYDFGWLRRTSPPALPALCNEGCSVTTPIRRRSTPASPACSVQHLNDISSEDKIRLELLKSEYESFISTGIRVPAVVEDEDWLKLLNNCKTISSRKRYYTFLFKREKKKLSNLAKKKQNILLQEARKELIKQMQSEGDCSFKNTFLLRVLENTMNRWYYNNLYYALINGPHLAFDLSYENQMTEQELNSLVYQMQLCHHINKINREPFYFHFCNVLPNSVTSQKLQKALLQNKDGVITVTDNHYLKCFDKSQIIYLSPNAPTVMTEYDHDAVYVIGGIVDKAVEKPLTLAKAKKEKLRTVRLPIEKYVKWVSGTKSLTLTAVVSILLDFKNTGNWTESFTKNLKKGHFSNK